MGRCIIMNWKVFFKELFKSIDMVTCFIFAFIICIIGLIYIPTITKMFIVIVAIFGSIIAVIMLVLNFYHQSILPAYEKAKQAKPKCHWKIKWPRYNGDDTAIFQTECNETISGIREKCKCGKEVVVDL